MRTYKVVWVLNVPTPQGGVWRIWPNKEVAFEGAQKRYLQTELKDPCVYEINAIFEAAPGAQLKVAGFNFLEEKPGKN